MCGKECRSKSMIPVLGKTYKQDESLGCVLRSVPVMSVKKPTHVLDIFNGNDGWACLH